MKDTFFNDQLNLNSYYNFDIQIFTARPYLLKNIYIYINE